MQWCREKGPQPGLRRVSQDPAIRARAEALIFCLGSSGHPHARTRAKALSDALAEGFVSDEELRHLSQWCNSGGSYEGGVEAAQQLSELLVGDILPRLAGAGIRAADGRRSLDVFLRRVGVRPCSLGSERTIPQDPPPGRFPIYARGGELIMTLDE